MINGAVVEADAALRPHQPARDQAEDVEMAQKTPAPSTRSPVEETLYRVSGYDNLNGIGTRRGDLEGGKGTQSAPGKLGKGGKDVTTTP